jgi:cytochrome c biogenesis protein CcdA
VKNRLGSILAGTALTIAGVFTGVLLVVYYVAIVALVFAAAVWAWGKVF